MSNANKFQLEASVLAWRRAFELDAAFSAEDVRELECHLRDQVEWLMAEGYTEEEAFRRALRDVGDYGSTETEYRKVYWPKARYRMGRLYALSTGMSMFTNYVKIAVRNLRRAKGFAALNLVGLAVGIAASLLIFQYVAYELSYDDFHAQGEDLYRVRYDYFRGDELVFKCATSFPMVGPAMAEEFPEVEGYARLFLRYGGMVVQHEDQRFNEENLFQADPSFLTLFSYPMLHGDAATALVAPNTAVIAADAARKYFGDDDPIGKRIRVGAEESYTITGVAESPENSHLKFTFLLSYATLVQQWGEDFDNAWGWYDFYNYLKLAPGADPAAVEAKFSDFVARHDPQGQSGAVVFSLQPLRSIHLHSDLIQEARVNGDATSVYFLALIAGLILLIAWINYVNLSTARAMRRAKEIGIRKVVGAHRQQLIRQFVLESILLNVMAAVLALGLAALAMPLFNGLTGTALGLSLVGDARLWLGLAVVFVGGALLSGFYPALVLSSYRPALVLKGSFAHTPRALLLRKGLVVLQFAASVGLIAGTLIISRQLDYMRGQDLGIDIEQTLVVRGPGAVADSVYGLRYESFKRSLAEHPAVQRVAASTEIPGNLIYWVTGARRPSTPLEQRTQLYLLGIDYDYLDLYGHRLLAGRSFDRDYGTDDDHIILTASALPAFQLPLDPAEAIGERMLVGRDTLMVAGVVEDYHQEGLDKARLPIGFRLQPQARQYFSVKLRSSDLPATLGALQQTYATFFPDDPFGHFFLDSFYDGQYRNYLRFGRVFGFFAGLAILVACLGLFGLASFTAAQRTKEIGIRKVMGSSISAILVLLSKDFLKLVVLASLVAIPVVWFIMARWLGTFAFRIDMPWWAFAVAGLAALAIAALTVAYQTIKAALANPAHSLRYE